MLAIRFPANTKMALNTAIPRSSGTSPDSPAAVSASDAAEKLAEGRELDGDRRKGDVAHAMAPYQLGNILAPGLCKKNEIAA